MTLSHGTDFAIELTNKAMVAEYSTNGHQTILVIVERNSEELFNSEGQYEIVEMIVANSNEGINVNFIPSTFVLSEAYPNPFNGQIYFDFDIPEKQSVTFSIYDLTGRKIFERLILPSFGGRQRVVWNGSNDSGKLSPSGMYLYRFSTNTSITTGKITYLK